MRPAILLGTIVVCVSQLLAPMPALGKPAQTSIATFDALPTDKQRWEIMFDALAVMFQHYSDTEPGKADCTILIFKPGPNEPDTSTIGFRRFVDGLETARTMPAKDQPSVQRILYNIVQIECSPLKRATANLPETTLEEFDQLIGDAKGGVLSDALVAIHSFYTKEKPDVAECMLQLFKPDNEGSAKGYMYLISAMERSRETPAANRPSVEVMLFGVVEQQCVKSSG